VTRALEPRISAFVDRDDAPRSHYEVFGEGDTTVVLLMPDTIVHSRAWKAQVPFLARYFQVVTIDPLGNGLSDRPSIPAQFDFVHLLDDAWSALDAVGVERAVLAGLCAGCGQALMMAADRPDRVLGVFAINPGMALTPRPSYRTQYDFDAVLDTDEGWAKSNRHYWLRDWPGFARFFFGEMFPEPHSSKQVEDCVSWALETTPEVMLLDADSEPDPRFVGESARDVCRAVRCPVFVVSGSLDLCQPPERGRIVADLTGGEYLLIDGAGHLPNARDPVKVNLLMREFVRRAASRKRPLVDA
jgi:pimeloyl-ACP methyl ester carboxylesterase